MLSYFSSLIIHPSPRAPRVDADSAERATRVGAARAANAETRGQTRERGENAPLGASFNSPGFLPRGTGVSTPGNRGFYPGEQGFLPRGTGHARICAPPSGVQCIGPPMPRLPYAVRR
jgi:hypothetical protein